MHKVENVERCRARKPDGHVRSEDKEGKDQKGGRRERGRHFIAVASH